MSLSGKIPPKAQMFMLSFTALFLELMVIRWVPSVVRLVAYYANLMLLSSFLGLGVGAMVSGRKWRLFGWFPFLLAVEIGSLLLCRHLVLGTSGSEMRFSAAELQWGNCAVLVGIFAVNTLLFVPIGQQMGMLFNTLPRLGAYAWDLGGSLCGTLVFGLFSLLHFSPVLGMLAVMLLYLGLATWRSWLWSVPVFLLVLAGMFAANDRATRWSPYYYIVVRDGVAHVPVPGDPPADLRTMRDPPYYSISVNQDFYHADASFDLTRHTPGTLGAQRVEERRRQYGLPYQLGAGHERVLVVGAGGGADVQAALIAGATHVDAVEIDPVIVGLSRRFNPDAPYDDPRVHVHVDDARSFFSKATGGYDLVVFGYLDSQALFSSMSNLRLDGYVYTVESVRAAYGLLNEHGMLSLSFGSTKDWMALKLYRTVLEATGHAPIVYLGPGHIVLLASRTAHATPLRIGNLLRVEIPGVPAIDVPTDDWPYLYLVQKTIPADYLIVIGSLLVLSLASVYALRGRSFGRTDGHFFLLGLGFLLLETKSIGDCSLYFGATWVVTLLVVAGVLLMVLAANMVAGRLRGFTFRLYFPLFAALALTCLMPREQILALGFAERLLWTLLAVPLPVFFAGLIFSTMFREAANPSLLFGANLIGAMVGGFAEYLGMAVGSQHLSLLVIAAYAGSLFCLLNDRRGSPLAVAQA